MSKDLGQIEEGIVRICIMCCKKIKKENKAARNINGIWVCNDICLCRLLKEMKSWTAENRDVIYRMHTSYEERKRAESN